MNCAAIAARVGLHRGRLARGTVGHSGGAGSGGRLGAAGRHRCVGGQLRGGDGGRAAAARPAEQFFAGGRGGGV